MKFFKSFNFIIIFLLIGMSACKKESEDITAVPMPEQSIEEFSVTETKDGKPNWILDAASAQIMEKENRVLLESPKIKFYQDGEYVSTLVAAKGRINTENYDIWGEGECILDTKKGDRLETSNLYYKSDIKKILTDENVKLIKEDEIIYGKGMEATPNLESIIIKKQRVELKNES